MAAKMIDGEAVAKQITDQVIEDAAALTAAGRQPHLVAVQVGENPASKIYTNMQKKSCEEVGIAYDLLELDDGISQDDLLAEVQKLNDDAGVHGIIL